VEKYGHTLDANAIRTFLSELAYTRSNFCELRASFTEIILEFIDDKVQTNFAIKVSTFIIFRELRGIRNAIPLLPATPI
jgi:hypothetical protein